MRRCFWYKVWFFSTKRSSVLFLIGGQRFPEYLIVRLFLPVLQDEISDSVIRQNTHDRQARSLHNIPSADENAFTEQDNQHSHNTLQKKVGFVGKKVIYPVDTQADKSTEQKHTPVCPVMFPKGFQEKIDSAGNSLGVWIA
jgi:hypothetical protein